MSEIIHSELVKKDVNGFTAVHNLVDGSTVVQDYEDLTEHVESCKRKTNESPYARGIDGSYHAASIPLSKFAEWCAKKGTTINVAARDEKMIWQFLAEHPVFDLTRGRTQRVFNGVG